MLSNRISHFFNFKGPSMTIDTACSGSLVGLDVACRYLHTGEVDGAIIGGANMYFSPEHNLNSELNLQKVRMTQKNRLTKISSRRYECCQLSLRPLPYF